MQKLPQTEGWHGVEFRGAALSTGTPDRHRYAATVGRGIRQTRPNPHALSRGQITIHRPIELYKSLGGGLAYEQPDEKE